MNLTNALFAMASLASFTLLACADGADERDVTTAAATTSAITAAPAPAACADVLGGWTGTLGQDATVSILHGAPQPLTGTIDFTLSAGAADQANFDGTLNAMLPGLGAVAAPLSGLTIGCDGRIAIDGTQSFPGVGDVHFVINGTLSGGGNFDVDTPATALVAVTATGSVTFARK
jgi:hypothetical protein